MIKFTIFNFFENILFIIIIFKYDKNLFKIFFKY